MEDILLSRRLLAICVQYLNRERESILGSNITDDNIKIFGFQRAIVVVIGHFLFHSILVVVTPDLFTIKLAFNLYSGVSSYITSGLLCLGLLQALIRLLVNDSKYIIPLHLEVALAKIDPRPKTNES